MFVLAHMGIGGRATQACNRSFTVGWVILGALLPDLIDKPLYHLSHLALGGPPDGGVISCTRTFGHCGIVIAIMALVAIALRSRIFGALAVGMAFHVYLDVLQDVLTTPHLYPTSLQALFFPFVDSRFGTHSSVTDLRVIVPAEALGLVFLFTWRDLRQSGLWWLERMARLTRPKR